MQDKPFSSRAIAYLKAAVADGADNGRRPVIELSREQSFVMHPVVAPLVAMYAVDTGNEYQLVQNRHLTSDGLDAQALQVIGLKNLALLANSRGVRVQPYGNIFAVLMGGDFEASLMLLDAFWDKQLRQFVKGDYAVAVPARDMLAFCDASSAAGVDELRQVIQRVFPGGDHLLSDRIYVRRQGRWEVLSTN